MSFAITVIIIFINIIMINWKGVCTLKCSEAGRRNWRAGGRRCRDGSGRRGEASEQGDGRGPRPRRTVGPERTGPGGGERGQARLSICGRKFSSHVFFGL